MTEEEIRGIISIRRIEAFKEIITNRNRYIFLKDIFNSFMHQRKIYFAKYSSKSGQQVTFNKKLENIYKEVYTSAIYDSLMSQNNGGIVYECRPIEILLDGEKISITEFEKILKKAKYSICEAP